MAGLLADQVAIITGGGSGLGRRVAQRFAEEGAKAIVIVDVRPTETSEALLAELRDAGLGVAFVEADVRDPRALVPAVEAARAWGGATVLVNSAGVLRASDIFDVTEEEYDLVVDINQKGTFFACQTVARDMVDGGRTGSIVNLSSTSGLRGESSSVPYVASKGAVRLMTYGLAAAFGKYGIRVNAIHPGLIATPMTEGQTNEQLGWRVPLGRQGTTDDVADAAVYLASPLSSFVTATSQVVDGGMTNTVS